MKVQSLAAARLSAHNKNAAMQEAIQMCAEDLTGEKTFVGWREACEVLLKLAGQTSEDEVVEELATWYAASKEMLAKRI